MNRDSHQPPTPAPTPLARPAPTPSSPAEAPVLWRSEGTVLRRSKARPGEILYIISRARRNLSLYGPAHPFIAETFATLNQLLQGALTNRPSLRIFIHEDTFFLENTVLLEDSLQLHPLLLAFEEREIGAMRLDAGVAAWELTHLIEVLNLDPKEVRRIGGAEVYLKEHKVQRIAVGVAGSGGLSMEAGLDPLPGRGPGEGEDERHRQFQGGRAKADPQDAYRAGLRVQDEMTYQASIGMPLNLRKARAVVNSFIDIIAEDNIALPVVAMLKNYDEDTYHHSLNVSVLSLMIGERLQLSRELLMTLGLAALLHDIGKVRIPQELLNKPGKLTPDEMALIRRHPIYGAHALRDLPGLARLAMVVAFEHHANYNLSGYPPLAAKDLPHLLTRIVQIADVFDAMTSTRRLYRRPLMRVEALQVIFEGAGTLFDPVVAKMALRVLTDLSHALDAKLPA